MYQLHRRFSRGLVLRYEHQSGRLTCPRPPCKVDIGRLGLLHDVYPPVASDIGNSGAVEGWSAGL